MPLNSGLCALDGWELDTTCMQIPPDTTPEVIETWRRVAAELLYALTGNRFGPSCPIVVRPCRKKCAQDYLLGRGFWPAGWNGTPWIPYIDTGGVWRNASMCGCTSQCHCGPELCEVYLPGPIYDVVSVEIDGVLVPPGDYSILDGQYLVRSSASNPDGPGVACWPSCQDMSLVTGPGTFVVTYRTGIPLSALGTQALSALAAHYIKGCGGCGCGIGSRQNLQSMTRQGVSLEFADPQQVLEAGRTGIDIVDQFIYAVTGGRPGQRQMRVLSPDAPKRPRIWTAAN